MFSEAGLRRHRRIPLHEQPRDPDGTVPKKMYVSRPVYPNFTAQATCTPDGHKPQSYQACFPTDFIPCRSTSKRRFGQRISKIPLDAGSSCPNRDGTLSAQRLRVLQPERVRHRSGRHGMSLPQQYLAYRDRSRNRDKNTRFLGYIQSFSNTYGPAERLRRLLQELAGLPDLAGLAIGTRPDCLDEEKLEILQNAPFEELWLDLGLQSAQDSTLRRINRGHDAACFAEWARKAADSGIKVCAHVITGLPGENLADFEQTILFVNRLPVSGIKIHNLYICRDTPLESAWHAGTLELLSREASLSWLVRAIALLRPEIVIHRLNSDPSRANCWHQAGRRKNQRF
jgi:uncharacterized protein